MDSSESFCFYLYAYPYLSPLNNMIERVVCLTVRTWHPHPLDLTIVEILEKKGGNDRRGTARCAQRNTRGFRLRSLEQNVDEDGSPRQGLRFVFDQRQTSSRTYETQRTVAVITPTVKKRDYVGLHNLLSKSKFTEKSKNSEAVSGGCPVWSKA